MAELARAHGIRVVLSSVLPVDDGDREGYAVMAPLAEKAFEASLRRKP